MKELIAGIDLGTTNSALAVVQDGQIKVIEIHGQPTMPSCVGLDPSGKLMVGQAAKNQMIASPEATILSIKRRMGEEIKVPLGEREFSPEEISSFILRELKQEAERQLGCAIHKAVVTVPAYFNERQRKATQVAGELAGLDVVRILNEPTAAALAYGAGQGANQTLLVYDLGGGTFDVSVVVVENGVVEVKASHGDTRLGGDDFDQLLVDHAVARFKEQHGADLPLDPSLLCRLKFVMEAAKCRLSDEPFVQIREEYLNGDRHLELEIQRSDYEEMINGLLEKTLHCVHQAMQDAKLLPADFDKVMLVGGSTRTPLVHRLLEGRVRVEPRFEINPDLIVAMGAAIQGAIIAGEKHHAILVDIATHTFSTSSLDRSFSRMVCVPLIPRNTPLPASKAEIFQTLHDSQETVKVDAYQGEGPVPEENDCIGEFRVQGLRKVPAGNPVVIKFDLDLNGMLKVTATEKETGLSKSVLMDTRSQGKKLDLDQARRNIQSLTGGPAPQQALVPAAVSAADIDARELLATAKDLRKRGELLVAQNISPEDAREINDLLRDSAECIGKRDWEAVKTNNETLSDLLFYLED